MPQNKYALARYHIIDLLLRKNEYVKTSLMVERCREQTGFPVSRRTIQLDIEAMRDDPFLGYYAPIDYSSCLKAYYYTDPDFQLLPFGFTADEVVVLETVRDFLMGKIKRNYFQTFCAIVVRISWMAKKC